MACTDPNYDCIFKKKKKKKKEKKKKKRKKVDGATIITCLR